VATGEPKANVSHTYIHVKAHTHTFKCTQKSPIKSVHTHTHTFKCTHKFPHTHKHNICVRGHKVSLAHCTLH
jgi:hypothetical protein